MSLGERIKNIRQKKGLSLDEFGKLIGATKGNVSLWENGKVKPNNARLKAIANLANPPVDELLHGRKSIDLEEFRKQINKRIKARAQFGAPTDLQIAIDIAEELAHES